jgi:alpha-mannosidase
MNIRRSVGFTFLLLIMITQIGWSQKEITVNYFSPYQYDAVNNTVKAWIEARALPENFAVLLDGKELKYSKTNSGAVDFLFPLAGKTGELVVYSDPVTKSDIVAKQIFTPLVPSDWGYFGKGTVNIICSSHQDIAWMNTPDSCREQRIHDIIIPALDLIDKNPSYRFEMEQTLNLMEILEAIPSEKQRIVNAYKNGQFTWGATFNQPYEGLESGEQMVRQTYLGRKWITQNLPGMDAQAAYNVDVPGRSLQSPQILEKAGIKYLFVSRMKEGFFNWYSPDGTRILTYSPGNYGWALLVYKYFEDDAITALQKLHQVLQNWNEYYASHKLPPHYAVIISTDAGGPKDYSKIIAEWNEIAKSSGMNIPVLQHATTEEFLGKIDIEGIKPDSISGERPDLWLYIHGPAHYEAIKAKKSAAVSLPAAEIYSSINGMVKGSFKGYPSANITKGWYKAIYPDHGWGGNHGEITDSIFRASLEEGDAIGRKILAQSLTELVSEVRLRNPNSILVCNDLSWTRSGIATLDISEKKGNDWIVTDVSGNIIPSRIIPDGSKKSVSFIAENVPSLGYKTFTLRKGKASSEAVTRAGSNFYENSYYSIEFGPGGIRSLYDKELKKQVFNTTKYAVGDVLSLGYDGNGAGEFIQIKPTNFEGVESLGIKSGTWTLTSNGALGATYESESKMKNFRIKQKITVYNHSKRIDFEYEIPDWPGEHNRQLRVAFPLNMSNSQITYDVPMGILNVGKDEMNRSPLGWSWEGTYRQLPAEINPREIENFISASDINLGVTLSTNLAVADWIDPGRESVDYPVLQGIMLSSHKSCHYLGNWYHQTGSHNFIFSLTSHEPGWKNGYHFGVEGNHPFDAILVEKSQSGTLPEELSFISTSSQFVRITALKKSETGNSLILRMVEMEGKDEKIEMKLYFPVKALFKTNIIEEDEKNTGQNGNLLNIDIGKNSIETFRMDF